MVCDNLSVLQYNFTAQFYTPTAVVNGECMLSSAVLASAYSSTSPFPPQLVLMWQRWMETLLDRHS